MNEPVTRQVELITQLSKLSTKTNFAFLDDAKTHRRTHYNNNHARKRDFPSLFAQLNEHFKIASFVNEYLIFY